MANERCPDCGAMFALVGYRHLCRPRIESSDGVGERAALTGKSGTTAHRQERVAGLLRSATTEASLATGPSDSTTYRYRNVDERREYMRDHMRKKRAEKRNG